MSPIRSERKSGFFRVVFLIGIVGLILGVAGCQSIKPQAPVQTYTAPIPDSSVAVVRLVSAESGFWRAGQDLYVESIDGQTNYDWVKAKVLKFAPGAHTMKVIYCAQAGIPNARYAATGQPVRWKNIYDRQEIGFELAAGRTYDLVYDVKQWPTPHNLRLRLVDISTQETVADSGASQKEGIMPIGTIP